MKCKCCHNEIERTDLYCRYCGNQLYKSQKKELTIPKPKLLSDSTYSAQMMVNGERFTVKADTLEEYEVKARAIKLELLEKVKKPHFCSLSSVIDSYIDNNRNILSPSTIRGYLMIRNNRFKDYMPRSYLEIDYQRMVNDEVPKCSAKTLVNAFALVKSSLKRAGYSIPEVNLPTVITPDLLFLDYEQIPIYLTAIYGKAGELASILALHSLRMSELLAITVNDVDDNYITVNKAIVRDDNNQYVQKITKTVSSTRQIPVMIPRLLELLPSSGRLVTNTPTAIEKQIRKACESSSLPYVGCHGLRRSFASLAFHLHWDERSIMSVGGWSNMQTVHKVYIKLAQQDLKANTSSMADFYQITTEDRKPLV